MNYQIGFVITAILLVSFVLYYIFQKKAWAKKLSDDKPLQLKYDELRKDYDKLKNEKAKEPEASDNAPKKGKKSGKNKKETKDISELQEKVRSLKEDNDRLKEKNYNLSRDNDKLRQRNSEDLNSGDNVRRELTMLRDENNALKNSLENAEKQARSLEAKNRELQPQAKNAESVSSEDNAEKLAAVEREKAALTASLKDLRAELTAIKRQFQDEVSAAKQFAKDESSHDTRALRKELAQTQRTAEQAKKRAENNHKIYLITRSQLQILEQRIHTLDPAYHPLPGLPVKDETIDEYVKKFLTMEARESRASTDVLRKKREIQDLETKVQRLERELDLAKTSESERENTALNNALDAFENALANGKTGDIIAKSISEKGPASAKDAGKPLASLDLSNLDDDWDSI